MTDLISRLYRYGKELQVCNEAADEIERLTQALKKANDQAEHFEREWYLRGDEIERLRAALRNLLDMDVAYMRGPKVEEAVEAARAALKEKP